MQPLYEANKDEDSVARRQRRESERSARGGRRSGPVLSQKGQPVQRDDLATGAAQKPRTISGSDKVSSESKPVDLEQKSIDESKNSEVEQEKAAAACN